MHEELLDAHKQLCFGIGRAEVYYDTGHACGKTHEPHKQRLLSTEHQKSPPTLQLRTVSALRVAIAIADACSDNSPGKLTTFLIAR